MSLASVNCGWIQVTSEKALIAIKKAFKQRGGQAMTNARKRIVNDFACETQISESLQYFSKVTLKDALPVFPALLSMGYEAAGGKDNKKTIPFGEALVLISAAADLHDDVIDRSFVKGSKATVLGKFNDGIAILAGDILLVQGLKRLAEACESLPTEKARSIIKLVADAVTEICEAEAIEGQLHKKGFEVTVEEFLDVVNLKAVVPEVSMQIGAIIADGNKEMVDSLGKYGRLYGVNSIVFEELADLLNVEELKNRLKNECPPLPMLYALSNSQVKENILKIFKSELTENAQQKVADTVLESQEVNKLVELLKSNAQIGVEQTQKIKRKIGRELKDILTIPLQLIEV
jgi:geranylgeranyl pyrophosphate synthase